MVLPMNIYQNSFFACEDLRKSYGGQLILDDISIYVEKGELVSLLGVSGVGKTTLFQLIAGLEPLDSGKVFREGKEISGRTGLVGYMQQKDLLLPFRTILDNVCLPDLLKGMPINEARNKVTPMLDEFGLGGSEYKYPDQISGGMRQRAALLRTYLYSGSMMLLDEPFSALDAITKSSMHNWFFDMVHSKGISTLLITHDIDEAILLSQRIYIMSGAPARISDEIKVDTKIPRSEFALSEEFLRYKQRIIGFWGEV